MPGILDVIEDFKQSSQNLSKLFKEMDKDREFERGEQWEDDLKNDLRKAGVTPLTINKVRSIIKLISGIERQSSSDFKAFPEGEEDSVTAEIVTKLMKHVTKTSNLKRKQSAQFANGCKVGLSYLEPFIDYTHDILNGELKFKEVDPTQVYFDPKAKEYDLSDARYLIKLTTGLDEDELLSLFPDKESEIKNLTMKRFEVDDVTRVAKHIQFRDYPDVGEETQFDDVDPLDGGFDLVEYYYKSPITEYYIADRAAQTLVKVEDKKSAEEIQESNPQVDLIEHATSEIRLKQMVGVVELSDEVAPFYPAWKEYPLFAFFAEHDPHAHKWELAVQGITRAVKDLNIELNKRRTQKLRHLNSTANSGFFIPKGAVDKRDLRRLKQFGSSPGFVGEFDAAVTGGSGPESWRIRPQPLSQGHEIEAQQNDQDIKESSGVNPDLLANDSQSQSGRAILLKQRQGLVMAQELLDNYSETKRSLGKFILSQLGEVFTVERAVRVLGEKFIEKNFKRSVQAIFEDAVRKQETQQPLSQLEAKVLQSFANATPEAFLDPQTGLPLEQVDQENAGVVINQILNDAEVGKFEVAIGEGAFHETVQMANFAMLQSMVEQGIPIPPEVLINESTLSEGTKEQVKTAISQAQSTGGT